MDVVSRASHAPTSALNPNAAPFVPLSYRMVEDFSDQWWALVQSSPWFRDYWLQERFSDPQDNNSFPSAEDLVFPDLDSFFDILQEEEEEGDEDKEEECCRDLVSSGLMNWRKARTEKPRHAEKVPKIVNLKMMPKKIQQPR